MAEFALGQAAMVQNGNWGWSQINGVDGNTVKAEDVKFLPIYTGVEGEENQGLCTGTENFFCINKEASAEDQAASIAFVEWLFSSETGKAAVTNDLGFIAPFDTFSDDEKAHRSSGTGSSSLHGRYLQDICILELHFLPQPAVQG